MLKGIETRTPATRSQHYGDMEMASPAKAMRTNGVVASDTHDDTSRKRGSRLMDESSEGAVAFGLDSWWLGFTLSLSGLARSSGAWICQVHSRRRAGGVVSHE